MQIRLAYLNTAIGVCRACYGHHWVEKLTGPHGPVEDARNQEQCTYCEEREGWEHENKEAREDAIHKAEAREDAEKAEK